MGIDLAERSAYGHLDEVLVRRAAERWLRAQERAWCATQPSFREAFIVVLSCKEAMYKAWRSAGEVPDISLAVHGHATAGWASWSVAEPVSVMASWLVLENFILTLAVAAPAAAAHDLLEVITASLPSALRARFPTSATPPAHPIAGPC